ncbi:hypothetical protein [Spirosoma pomorum]
MKQLLYLLGFLLVSAEIWAGNSADSTAKSLFPKLTKQMRLKYPALKEDEYEVRIWNRVALKYGNAQVAYILRKTKKRLRARRYVINWKRENFRSARRQRPTITPTHAFWNRLMRRNILTLPDERVVFDRLYPPYKPQPITDTVEAGMQADGSFTLKGYRIAEKRNIIADGEYYLFEVFGANSYRVYSSSNPSQYSERELRAEELQNMVGILRDFILLFRSDIIGRDEAREIYTK